MMSSSNDEPLPEEPAANSHHDSFDAYLDAREIIRLTQCIQCSRPLHLPVRLPCGNTICRSCLPAAHKRKNITYPLTDGRDEGFYCPFPKDGSIGLGSLPCGAEHALGDCGVDVTLNKTVEVFEGGIKQFDSPEVEEGEAHMFLSSQPGDLRLDDDDDPGPPSLPCRVSRLVATFRLAQKGELPFSAGINYISKGDNQDVSMAERDRKIFDGIKETLRGELDCQVCYSLILDACTTACGHTFCRACAARVLDHSNLCPICRRKLPIATLIQSEPKNARLDKIIVKFFPSTYTTRLEAARKDEVDNSDQVNVPLFVCTLSFPSTPTYLHVFELRYRLMIRRALESGDRKFGMVMCNRSGSLQGELGSSPFMQYGTMLKIDGVEMLPDGRSFISTTGLYKFKVVQSSVLDGYHVGRIERVHDVPISDEENMEARETASASLPGEGSQRQIDHLSTQHLFQKAQDFIKDRRAQKVPFANDRVFAAYGQPPSNPATFPYWLANILPVPEEERYALLPATSVRERLKITARWIEKLEDSQS